MIRLMGRRRTLGLVALPLVAFALALAVPAEAASKKHYANEDGHYAGGKGSSHKGGHYVNKRTHNHYTKHKR